MVQAGFINVYSGYHIERNQVKIFTYKNWKFVRFFKLKVSKIINFFFTYGEKDKLYIQNVKKLVKLLECLYCMSLHNKWFSNPLSHVRF